MTADDDSLWQSYALDAQDALREIEDTLLGLEADPHDVPTVHRLYRALHTLKGNSAVVGLAQIEALAHAVEDIVGKVRDGAAMFDARLVELTLALTDGLAGLVRQAAAQRADAAEEQVAPLLARARQRLGEGAAVAMPESGPTRGQILIFSSAAPPQPEAALDPMSAELFLGVARKVLTELAPQLSHLESGSCAAQDAVLLSCEELRAPAERLGLMGVHSAALQLRDAVLKPDRQPPHAELAELGRQLGEVETRYRAVATEPQEFGIALLAAQCQSALPAASGGSRRPSRRALRRSLRPGARRSLVPVAAARTHDESAAKNDSLRVDARRLSHLLDLAGEIALAAGAVTHHPDLLGRELEGFAAAAHELEVLIRELQNDVAVLRMVPVAGVFQSMKRVVRDTAKRTGKRVELQLVGEETEIDKVTADALHDPLVHLLRNAIDHGIESPEQRVAAGKPACGKIVLEAAHADGDIRVRVRDDGQGVVRSAVRRRALERGILASDATPSDRELLQLLFMPGFSTKEKIDEVSGRGVGLDVIKTGTEALRGRVDIDSQEGAGTCFTLTVPLTLAFMEAMVVRQRDRLFALPIEKIWEVLRASDRDLALNGADGELTIKVRDRLVPVLWLHRFYGEQTAPPSASDLASLVGSVVVAVQTSRGVLALPVDELLGNQPIMLKPMSGLLSNVRAAAGCGMLRNGDVAVALDCERLHVL